MLGPGLFFVLPCIDEYSVVDLRTITFDVPPQEVGMTQQIYFSPDKGNLFIWLTFIADLDQRFSYGIGRCSSIL